MKNILKDVAANEKNEKWNEIIKREELLYSRGNDIRSEFERDYTRIIHSWGYRRMKHKTQVFFSPTNDHICTRSEHVTLVESISNTIASYLGLNTELTKAISTAHDIGHSPFGHQGEKILSEISEKEIGKKFWHERNGLEMIDNIELLEDDKNNLKNLNLTYAVRDGIISHCGEIDENGLKPRNEAINLNEYTYPNQFKPFTWEGCIVKVADKIAYLGRDIQDAVTLGILDNHLEELYNLLDKKKDEVINNTVIINNLVYDICNNSNLEKGLCFSDENFEFMNKLKKFNYEYIYKNERTSMSTKYFELLIHCIYDTLKKCCFSETYRKNYYEVYSDFENWLKAYWNGIREEKYKNKVLFDVNKEDDVKQSIIYYISGMTDNFAMDTYTKIIGF